MKEVHISSLDERSLSNLAWCATAYRIDRLFWSNCYLFCFESYEKSLEYEEEKGVLPVGQICYAKMQKYTKSYDVEKSVRIPIVDVSDMYLYSEIARTIKAHEARNHRKHAQF